MIQLLADAETSIHLDALADGVAGRTQSTESGPGEHRRQTNLALRHVHLPKLAECGMVAYSLETDQIYPVDTELARELLAVLDSHE